MDRIEKNKSFTMIEVLGAVFILSVGVLGAYSVVQNIFIQTFYSSARLTAAYLAEEGLEKVRNIRDTAWIDSAIDDWANNGVNDGLAVGGGKYAHIYFGLPECSADSYCLASCPGSCAFDDLGYVGLLGSIPNAKFKRRIEIRRITADSTEITADVMWKERGAVSTVSIQSYLYNWK